MNNCVFCQIIEREQPANILYEDNEIIAFDALPDKFKQHYLIIPKRHIETLREVTLSDTELLGKMIVVATQLAKDKGISEPGYRISINTGQDAHQKVYHIHFHLIGGANL